MNFSIPVNEEQTRIKVVKKEEMAVRKEIKKFAPGQAAVPVAATTTPESSPPVGTSGSLGSSSNAPHEPITATAAPPHKATQPKVQLVEVEPGIYDIFFTCSCCEQFVIRCESIEKAAAVDPHPS